MKAANRKRRDFVPTALVSSLQLRVTDAGAPRTTFPATASASFSSEKTDRQGQDKQRIAMSLNCEFVNVKEIVKVYSVMSMVFTDLEIQA